jgi:hypothetical protein
LNVKKNETDLTNPLEAFVQDSATLAAANIDDKMDQDDKDNDFELISSDLDTNLDSNVSSNLDSYSSSNVNSTNQYSSLGAHMNSIEQQQHSFHQSSKSIQSDHDILKRNNLNVNQKGNKLKLFHHKSADVDTKKQTWQKQLLQTPFFKSFNTQQLLSHYSNHQQHHVELPDKIVTNLDDSEEADEPLLSGSGEVSKECSDELIQLWSNILIKWKKPNQRPAGLKDLIRYGIPQTLR